LTEIRVIEPEWCSGVALGTKVICRSTTGLSRFNFGQ